MDRPISLDTTPGFRGPQVSQQPTARCAVRVTLLPEEAQMNDSSPHARPLVISERMRERRRSYGDVARLGKLPRSTVHHLATHRRSGRLPNPATLERLAAGLDLPLNVVRAAAASAAVLV